MKTESTSTGIGGPLPAAWVIAKSGFPGIMAFMVGTGGLATQEYLAQRDQKGYPILQFDFHTPTEQMAHGPLGEAAPVLLAKVKDSFKTTISELANLFGVSRQAIYNWQAGGPLSAQNEERLESLTRAADMINASGRSLRAATFRRKLPGGQTFLQGLAAGQDVEPLSSTLFALLDSEALYGERIARREVGGTARADMRDAGLPNFDE